MGGFVARYLAVVVVVAEVAVEGWQVAGTAACVVVGGNLDGEVVVAVDTAGTVARVVDGTVDMWSARGMVLCGVGRSFVLGEVMATVVYSLRPWLRWCGWFPQRLQVFLLLG